MGGKKSQTLQFFQTASEKKYLLTNTRANMNTEKALSEGSHLQDSYVYLLRSNECRALMHEICIYVCRWGWKQSGDRREGPCYTLSGVITEVEERADRFLMLPV